VSALNDLSNIIPEATAFLVHILLYYNTHTHTHNRFTALWNLSGKTFING